MSYSRALPPTLSIAEDTMTDYMFNTFIDHSSLDELAPHSTLPSGPCTFPQILGYVDVPCFNPHCFDAISHEIERVSALGEYTPSLSPVDESCASWSSQDGDLEQRDGSSILTATVVAGCEEKKLLEDAQAEVSDLTDLEDLEEMGNGEKKAKQPHGEYDKGEDSDAERPLMDIWKRQKLEVDGAARNVKVEDEMGSIPAESIRPKKRKRQSITEGRPNAGQSTGRGEFNESYKKLGLILHPQATRWSRAFLLNYAADTITSLREDAVRSEGTALRMKEERDQAIFLAQRAEEQLKLFLKEERQKERRKIAGPVRFAL